MGLLPNFSNARTMSCTRTCSTCSPLLTSHDFNRKRAFLHSYHHRRLRRAQRGDVRAQADGESNSSGGVKRTLDALDQLLGIPSTSTKLAFSVTWSLPLLVSEAHSRSKWDLQCARCVRAALLSMLREDPQIMSTKLTTVPRHGFFMWVVSGGALEATCCRRTLQGL